MVPLPNLIAFSVAATVLILIPGPSLLFVIGRALSLGRIGGLLSVAGNSLGVFAQAVAVALGLGALIEASTIVFTIVKFGGAAFLIYLGIQAIRHRAQRAASPTLAPRSRFRAFAEGLLVGVSNPKTVVFFIAILPQFISVPAGNAPAQLLLLGAVFFVISLVSDGIWALVASAARAWFARSPRRIERLSATGGVAMIGLGGFLAISGVKH
ncbi:LysE family translocator [Galbitalea soli]|uniref:LysE family translocator n=1 Tax=Galbitalea soli TaxID=1268042 RepID=A0A7C9TMA3_9MICO|nr:LysE family translocator [Galbitalea soli]NEM89737.1 LysE family translocator [Galbitalea soli]NYJ30437.1 threonine/homoserine/homoserine lactone efflux protein [Galbitalea soli]